MEKYIVGIVFGREETTAWLVPESHINSVSAFPDEGMPLRLIEGGVDEHKLSSAVYFDREGNYSLVPVPGMGVYMKDGNVSINNEERTHYQNFIRLVIERLLKLNGDILKINNSIPNFRLCVPTPSGEGELDLLNDAVADLHLKFQPTIGVNEAPYFAYIQRNDQKDQTVLVANITPYAIDYTLMRGGHTIPDGNRSNNRLGTSNIEWLMLNTISTDDGLNLEQKLAVTTEMLNSKGINHINPLEYLLGELRKVRKSDDINDSNIFDAMFRFSKFTGDPYFLRPIYDLKGDYETVTAPYREDVAKDLSHAKSQILKATNGMLPDIIIAAGEAVTMGWYKKLLTDTFPGKHFLSPRWPDYLVAEGVARYARLLALNGGKTFMA